MSQTMEKCPSRSVEESLKMSGSESGSRWLPQFNQFFLIEAHTCDKIFTKIHSVVFT